MFNVKIKQEILKEFIGLIRILSEDATIYVRKTELYAKVVDSSHVAMTELVLEKDAFEEYNTTEGQLAISLKKIDDFLKLSKPDAIISINHDENKNRLIITMGNIIRQMPFVDLTGVPEPKVPSLNLPVKITLRVDEIKQLIKGTEGLGDYVKLTCSPESFIIFCEEGSDTLELKLDKSNLIKLECKDKFTCTYPKDYFVDIIKNLATASEATFCLGKDYPLRMEFSISNGKGFGKYYLAPRIED